MHPYRITIRHKVALKRVIPGKDAETVVSALGSALEARYTPRPVR